MLTLLGLVAFANYMACWLVWKVSVSDYSAEVLATLTGYKPTKNEEENRQKIEKRAYIFIELTIHSSMIMNGLVMLLVIYLKLKGAD